MRGQKWSERPRLYERAQKKQRKSQQEGQHSAREKLQSWGSDIMTTSQSIDIRTQSKEYHRSAPASLILAVYDTFIRTSLRHA